MIMKMITDVRKKEKRKKEKRKKEKKRRKKEKWSVKNCYTKEKEASSKLFMITFSDERNSRIKSKKESLSATINPGLSIILNQVDWSTCRLIFVAFQAYVTVNLSFSHPETSWVISVNWQILGQSIWTKQWKTRQKIRLNMIRK